MAGTALFGCSRAAILGRPLATFVVPDDRAAVTEHLRFCASRRLRAWTDARLLGKDGTEHTIRIVTAPFLRASVGELAVVALIHDFARTPPMSSPLPTRSEA